MQDQATNDVPDREGGGEQRAPRERRGGRDRYGRDRRDRAPRDETADSADAAIADTGPVPNQEESADAAPVRGSYFNRPAAEEHATSELVATPAAPVTLATPAASSAPVSTVSEPEPVSAAPTTALVALVLPAVVPLVPTAPRPAPVAKAAEPAAPVPQGLPSVGAFVLPIEEMNQVAQASGLEWVNSNAEKVAQVQAAIAAEPRPIHVPREPKPAVLLDDGSLVLVETRKDLRQVTLPFETPSAS